LQVCGSECWLWGVAGGDGGGEQAVVEAVAELAAGPCGRRNAGMCANRPPLDPPRAAAVGRECCERRASASRTGFGGSEVTTNCGSPLCSLRAAALAPGLFTWVHICIA